MIDPRSNTTFADLYKLDERKFAGDSVMALRFSNRTSKRFRRSGIVTITDLLMKTPAQMMDIEGFGIGCLAEIEQILSVLNEHNLRS